MSVQVCFPELGLGPLHHLPTVPAPRMNPAEGKTVAVEDVSHVEPQPLVKRVSECPRASPNRGDGLEGRPVSDSPVVVAKVLWSNHRNIPLLLHLIRYFVSHRVGDLSYRGKFLSGEMSKNMSHPSTFHLFANTLSNCGVLALMYLAKSARKSSCSLPLFGVAAPALEKGSLYGFSCLHRNWRNSKDSHGARHWIAANAAAKTTWKDFLSIGLFGKCHDCSIINSRFSLLSWVRILVVGNPRPSTD